MPNSCQLPVARPPIRAGATFLLASLMPEEVFLHLVCCGSALLPGRAARVCTCTMPEVPSNADCAWCTLAPARSPVGPVPSQSEEIKFKQEAKTRLVVDLALRAADKGPSARFAWHAGPAMTAAPCFKLAKCRIVRRL